MVILLRRNPLQCSRGRLKRIGPPFFVAPWNIHTYYPSSQTKKLSRYICFCIVCYLIDSSHFGFVVISRGYYCALTATHLLNSTSIPNASFLPPAFLHFTLYCQNIIRGSLDLSTHSAIPEEPMRTDHSKGFWIHFLCYFLLKGSWFWPQNLNILFSCRQAGLESGWGNEDCQSMDGLAASVIIIIDLYFSVRNCTFK